MVIDLRVIVPLEMSDSHLKQFLNVNRALVLTGGSSGIGKCFIERLHNVDHNFPICNLSRSRPSLERESPALTHHAIDLAEPIVGEHVLRVVHDFLAKVPKEGPVALINNSGVGAYGKFNALDIERQLKMIELNVCAVVHLTWLLLPIIKQRGGTIINIASTAAFQPTPELTTYGATKSFLLNWSLALNEDLRGSRARVLCVCPGPTATHFFKAAGFDESPLPDWLGQRASQVVDATIKAWAKKRPLVISGLSNKLIISLGACFPRTWTAYFSGLLLRRVRKQ